MKRALIYASVVVLLLSAVVSFVRSPKTQAADTRNFNPELIISDSVFRNADSMTASQIQWFLESKDSTCLKDKYVLSLHDSDSDGLGDEPYGLGKNNKVRVSALIKQASRIYGINPRVILATLQKEQGLITRQDCPTWRYNTALGYGCPDSAPCDNSAYGFTRQIDYGTWHFRGFFLDTYPVPPTVPGTKKIQYNPDSRCGGKTITIRNRATAALYSYTPYQPNQYTLNGGVDDSYPNCGAFGNLNFWRYYTMWFGLPTAVRYDPMGQKRWLKLTKDVRKVNLKTGGESGEVIPTGAEVYFVRKSYFDESMYLQSEHDFRAGVDRGIRFIDLAEIPVVFTTMSVPRWMNTTIATPKVHPVTLEPDGGSISRTIDAYYTDKFTVGGTTYLRTRHDTDNNVLRGIPMDKLKDANVNITELTRPRWFEATKDSAYTNVATGDATTIILKENSRTFFTHKFYVNGQLYLNTEDPGSFLGVAGQDFTTVNNGYVPFLSPRTLKLTENTMKVDTATMQQIPPGLLAGTELSFASKVTINGALYVRTAHDTKHDVNRGIPFSLLQEVD